MVMCTPGGNMKLDLLNNAQDVMPGAAKRLVSVVKILLAQIKDG